jgi:hypothetical protein
MRSKASTRQTQFAVCTDNSGHAASLEVGKLYPIITDAEAAKHGYIRVIDESGEDYGYSFDRFFPVKIPDALTEVLRSRSDERLRRSARAVRPAASRRRLSR